MITTAIQETGPAIAPPQSYTLEEDIWMLLTAISTFDTAAKKWYSQDTDMLQKYARTMLCGHEPERFHPYKNLLFSTQDPAEIIRSLLSGTLSDDQLDDLGFRAVVSEYSK